jgi:hypothetical protein
MARGLHVKRHPLKSRSRAEIYSQRMGIFNLIMPVGAWVDVPQRPTGWQRHGAAGVAGAHRSSALQGYGAPFSLVSLPTEPVGARNSPRGSSFGGGSGAGRAATRFKPQPLATVGERSKGRLMTKLGQTGVAWNVEHRRRVDGAQGASHAAWRWKGRT